MKAFDIGWIPQGWTRGEPLKVRNLAGPDVVAIIDQDRSVTYTTEGMVEAIMVTVAAGQEDYANEWLKWWRGS